MTRQRNRLSVCLALLVLLVIAIPGVQAQAPGGLTTQSSAAQAPSPAAASHTIFLPLVGIQFTPTAVPPTVRFWADRYALPEGGCTTLHWHITGATLSITLDDATVGPTGSQQVCPSAQAQFYTLTVQGAVGDPQFYEVDLTSGNPDLGVAEVIAQATVQTVTAATDVDPTTPGNQAGYNLQLINVAVLFKQQASWNEPTVTLSVPQSLIDFGNIGPVDWPVAAGQLVEFRATCDGAACSLLTTASPYLYLRSE